ncbi:E3 ubiquitin-protein ligase RHA1B-like [Phoenix dactylifera]|uniref:E3 ubiquitin-protein ligase RHA1B-like n=1 Tax=Phoenix dactylifera TaxID=42345 RepID=A0A8B8ZYN5_PHODC|nr:E3 ubiquitin-protein ligase RHA1B-like [Phoenix dactylifera]
MGFPVGYSELLLPKLLLHTVFLLGFVRRVISWIFTAVGLGDLLDSDIPWVDPPAPHGHGQHHRPEFRSASAMLIQEVLPVVRYEELAGEGQHLGDSCAVCLYEFEAAEEVRRLANCRHIFHRGCLDRWMEHDQRTCPLCRTPLIPEEMQDSLSDRLWAAAGVPDSFYDYYYSSFPSPPPTPTLLVHHQLQLLSTSI